MSPSQLGPKIHERFIVTCCLTITLAVVASLAFQRIDRESLKQKIELAFPETRLVQATVFDSNAPQDLLQAGVTTLVRLPYTLDDMLRYGLAQAWHPQSDVMEIRLADNKLTSNAIVYLTGQFGMDALQLRLRESEFICDVSLPAPLGKIEPDRFILEIPTGPMPAGFRRALFLPAGDWGRTRDLNQFTQAIYSLKPDMVIPYWRGGINAGYFFRSYFNTPWLRKPAVVVPEFSLPGVGRKIMRRQLKHNLFRAHYINRRLATKYTPTKLRQRIVRAVKERNVRLVYVDPPKFWTFARILHFYQAVKSDLKAAGFQIGAMENPPRAHIGHLGMMIIYLGLSGILFFFLWQVALWAVGFTGQDDTVDQVLTIRLKPVYFRWTALFFCIALLIVHWEGSAAWGGKIAAWLIATVVPVLSLMLFLPPTPVPENKWADGLWKSMKEFFTIMLWNLMAGLTIAVLLYHPAFIQRFDGFMGVKAAYLIPLLFIGIYLFPNVTDKNWWRIRFDREHWVWTVGAGVAIIFLLAILLIRSGNTSWLPITAWETELREGLERLLGVRPRFKEFLIGHPCLLIGLFGRRLPGQFSRIWPDICIVIGLVGQLSLINTFCHIHIPLVLSLLRTWHGLWLGLLLGSGATFLLRLIVLRRSIV